MLIAMSTLTLELPPREEQTAFNLRRWDEVLADPELGKLPGRVETDRHGRIIMSPPPAPNHGKLQVEIATLLKKLLPNGATITECPVSTADGVKGVDVAWASSESWGQVGNRTCFIRAPEICVEVASPSNSEEELREKMALYFDAGAKEVWICAVFAEMSFYKVGGLPVARSELCPEFPSHI
jgi:Uma2 family endonuclease